MRCLVLASVAGSCCINGAWAKFSVAGDLAPLNSPDGVLNAADALVLQRMISGSLTPTQVQMRVADVAPLNSPDGELNAGDLVVLMRAISGAITLPDIDVGPDAPVLDAVVSPTNANPYVVSGSGEPDVEIRLFVNGALADTAISGVDGSFDFNAILSDGVNAVYATAYRDGLESDASDVVSIDYRNVIDRNQTDAVITRDTVWSPGVGIQPYVIEGTLTVANGATLTILPGAVLSFGFGSALEIHGSAQIVGSATQPIIFGSDSPSPQAGDWRGVRIYATAADVTVSDVLIAWAEYGVADFGATGITVANNTIENMKYAGMLVSDGAAPLIESNTIVSSGYLSGSSFRKGNGIEIENASPLIRGNSISDHGYGILVKYTSSPVITALNSVTNNDIGIYLWGNYNDASGNPDPSITGNSIYQNANYNLMIDGYIDPVDPFGFVELELDASGNWWGSSDPSAIAEKIYDFKNTRGSNAPVLRVVPFLDAQNGAPVAGNFINGLYSNSPVLSSQEPYVVAGSFVVGSNTVLTVTEGVRLEFAKTTGLVALGPANIIGQPGSPVVFTSHAPVKAPGDWSNVALMGDASIVSFADIEYLRDGVQVQGASTTVSNSSISNFLLYGVRLETPVAMTVTNCEIAGQQRQGTGIWTDSSEALIERNTIRNSNNGVFVVRSPTLRDNDISDNNRGIMLFRGSALQEPANPTIEGNRITANVYGIYIDAYGTLTGDPDPAIHENEIRDNTGFNLYVKDYLPAVFVDATQNWWGTDDENAILATLNSFQIRYSPYRNVAGQLSYSQRLAGVLSSDVAIAPGEVRQVDTTVVVPQGHTLTLGSGSRLEFAPGAALVVNGGLAIDSDGADRPVLAGAVAQPLWGDYWDGLVVNADALDVHDLVVENARVGVTVYAGNVKLRDSRFSGCRDACVSFRGQYPNWIDEAVERLDIDVSSPSSSSMGMEFIHAKGGVSGSRVRNASKGIVVRGLSQLRVEKNDIASNATGLYITSDYGGVDYWPATPIVQNNNIQGNTVRGYETTAFGNDPTAVLEAGYNWWGTDQEPVIQAAIWDEADAGSLYPEVVYLRFLASAVAMPPDLDAPPSLSGTDTLDIVGQAAPSATVDIYVNDVVTGTAVADASGGFSASVPLTQGDNTIYAVATSASVASYPSRSYTVMRDTVAPVISLVAPTDGLLTNLFALTFQGSLSEPASLTVGGAAVAVDPDGTFSYGPVYLSEGANTVDLVATDAAGNITSRSVSLTLDSTPPAAPDAGLISFGAQTGGTVTVAGVAGAAEPGSLLYLTNARTGEVVQVVVQADGSFTAAIEAQSADDLALVASDALGNQAPWHSWTVAGIAASPAILSVQPSDGALVTGDRLVVTGTWSGPANTGITVNGWVAEVHADRFIVDGFPLEAEGANTLDIVATTPDGGSVTQSLAVTRAGTNLVSLSVESIGFGPPFAARLTLSLAMPLQSLSIDQEADGLTDWSATDVSATRLEVDLAYPEDGLHQGVVHAVDGAGTHHDIPFGVVLEDAMGVQSRRRHVYRQMLDRLEQGDIPGALGFFMGTSRARYEHIFSQLAGDLPTLAATLGDVDYVETGGDWAQLRATRDTAGGLRAYYITLVRGDDGVWRIEGM